MTTRPASIAEVLAAHEQRLNTLEANYSKLRNKYQELENKHFELLDQLGCAFAILAYLQVHETFDEADFGQTGNYSHETIEAALVTLWDYHPAVDAALKKIDPATYA